MITVLAENGWLEWLVGRSPDRTGTPRLEWAAMPESWGVFVLVVAIVAIGAAIIWLYRREIESCPRHIKLILAGLRLAVVMLFVALLLRPSVFFQQVTEIKPKITLLRDASLSLARADQYRDEAYAKQLASMVGAAPDELAAGAVSRDQLVNRILMDRKFLEAVRAKGTLQVVDFGDGTEAVAILPAIGSDLTTDDSNTNDSPEDAEPDADNSNREVELPPLKPTGLATDVWQALREALENPIRLAAIVIVSDGQHNASEDPLEMAERAGTLGIPIFTIGVGDPNPPRNLAVDEIFVRNQAYPDEPFEIESIIQINSLGGSADMPANIEVTLVEQKLDPTTGRVQSERIVEAREIAVPDRGGRVRVDFQHTVREPGNYNYVVRLPVLPNETRTDDNQQTSGTLEVVDQKVRVLLISGVPSWDYIQVQRLLQRDQTIALSCWLQSMDQTRPQDGDIPISRLPRTIEELGQYNIVIMMDPNPEEFDAPWIEMLKTFLRNKAGGLLFMAGPQYTAEFVTLNRLRGIRDILPVRLGDTEFIDLNQTLATAETEVSGRMLLVSHNLDHPVLSFHSDPAETARRWDQMPGIYWSFPAIAAKPTARVLMEHGDRVNAEGNQPLMVDGRFGAGTVLYMGFQGTWRWRPVGLQAQFFDRFWIQVTRYLVENRSLQGQRRGFVDTDQTQYELGQRIVFVSRLLNAQFQPLNEPTVTAVITDDQGRSQKIQMQRVPNQEGQYEGTWIAQRTGTFQATVELPGAGDSSDLVDPISFRVVPPSAEASAFWLNRKLLQEIADRSGGEYFELYEIGKLPEALPVRVERAEYNSPPEPLWALNNTTLAFFFLLPVALLAAEWTLRKWYRLM